MVISFPAVPSFKSRKRFFETEYGACGTMEYGYGREENCCKTDSACANLSSAVASTKPLTSMKLFQYKGLFCFRSIESALLQISPTATVPLLYNSSAAFAMASIFLSRDESLFAIT